MKKLITIIILFPVSILIGMDEPKRKVVKHYKKEIIEQSEQTPCVWDLNSYQQKNSIETVALLHLLHNSQLKRKNLTVLQHVPCSNINDIPTLLEDKSKFPTPKQDMLNSGGTFFCTFITQSNTQSLFLKPYVETFLSVLKKHLGFLHSWQKLYIKDQIKELNNRKYMTDDAMKDYIKTLGFKIISYEQKTFDIVIKNREEFIQFHIPLLTSDMINFMDIYISRKKLNKACILFIEHIMQQLKTNDAQELIYPFDTTVAILRKPKTKIITYD
jgi:hypothetical protein